MEVYEDEEESRRLPPRRTVHPSEKGKWTRRFYFSLVVSFTILIASLIGWFYWSFEMKP